MPTQTHRPNHGATRIVRAAIRHTHRRRHRDAAAAHHTVVGSPDGYLADLAARAGVTRLSDWVWRA